MKYELCSGIFNLKIPKRIRLRIRGVSFFVIDTRNGAAYFAQLSNYFMDMINNKIELTSISYRVGAVDGHAITIR